MSASIPQQATAISSDSLLDDGATTANTLTYTGTGGVSSPLVNIGTNPSASGTLNLPNSGKITSRNSGNSADIDMFRINGSNLLQVLSPEFSQVASAASAPAIYYTGTLYNSGTGTTNFPYWYINNGPTAPTTFSTSGEEFGINAPSGYTGNFLNFFTNGSASRFSVDYLGDVNATQVSTNASGAGNFQAYNSAGTFYTNWSSGATANNTIQGFAAAPVTGDVVDCVTTSTTCLLTDSGVLAANIITAITTTGSTGPAVQTGHSLNIPQYSGGGSLPSSTAGQTYYSNGTTGTATSAITVGGTTVGTALGTGGVEVNATLFEDTFAANSYATFNGSCASGVTTSCTITNGGNLDPLGGVVWAGAGDGSNDGEWIKYSSATSTTITFAASGRGYWGSTANTHGSGVQLPLVTKAVVRSASTAPYMISLQTGSTYYFPNATQSNNLGTGLGFAMGTTLFLQNGIAFSLDGNNKNYLAFNFGQIYSTNASSNVTLELSGNSLDYAIATQAITGNGTLTAITNAKTPQLQNNGSAAAAGTGGVLSSHCTIIWSQATAGTVAFGVAASATPGHVWVKEQDSGGTYVAPVFTTITTTTTTQTSGTVTPSAFGTNYATDLWIAMDPGTSNSPSIQLYASASANTLTIQPGTGCTAWQ